MKNKGIAIETILLLLVGMLVVGIIVYLVYKYTSGTILSVEKCRADIIQWCTICSNAQWSNSIGVPTDLSGTTNGCAKYSTFAAWGGYTNCQNAKNGCANVGIT